MSQTCETNQSYEAFIESKRIKSTVCGFEAGQLSPMLFPFQDAVVRWALRLGKAAIFADCGLGKTPMQLQWAQQVSDFTCKPVLILCPLAVASQTVEEGVKFGVSVNHMHSGADVRSGVNIINYERLDGVDGIDFGGIVLDESSILKGFNGSTRKALTEFAQTIPFRLACTATPAPNDLIEITNHAEFLGLMSGKEIIAMYFTQDGNTTHAWRLKGHARRDFWKWMATWSVAIRKPSDIGFDDGEFTLPPLEIEQVTVEGGVSSTMLFSVEALSLLERRQARKESQDARVAKVAELVALEPNEPWLIWCDLNSESEALKAAIPGCVEVKGSDSLEHKERSLLGFTHGSVQILTTKPSIAGFGLNWQHCARMAFTGLSDSYEQFYQAVRRCYRFGQTRPVKAYVVTGEREGAVVLNIQRKERQALEMQENIIKEMKDFMEIRTAQIKNEMDYEEDTAYGEGWTLHLGDSVKWLDRIEPESVGLSVFSPPFPGMYAYSNSAHDIGNTKSIEEMLAHFAHMPEKILNATMPGRNMCVHITQAPSFKGADGFVGLKDFRGELIAMMVKSGWIHFGEVTIDKDPQVKAVRTKEQSLLFKTLSTDSALVRMALADYMLIFKKPGENPEHIAAGSHQKYNPGAGWITPDEWCEWASPVWHRQHPGLPGGIRETDVLNVSSARDSDDERHLCPLQLGVIERCVKLWSNPCDLVLSPFAGVGSEGFKAIELGRKFVGIELKKSYWRQAQKNLTAAAHRVGRVGLFDAMEDNI